MVVPMSNFLIEDDFFLAKTPGLGSARPLLIKEIYKDLNLEWKHLPEAQKAVFTQQSKAEICRKI
jgi:hypothetical protein